MHSLLTIITDLGDTALLIPLTLVLSFYFAVTGCGTVAAVFLGAVGVTGLLVVGLKMTLIGCGPEVPLFHVLSPSGHAAMSFVVYGLLAQVAALRLDRWRSRLLGGGVLALLAAIGVSRVLLDCHSWQEVVIGAGLGAGIVALCRRSLRVDPSSRLSPRGLALLCLPVVILLNGTRLPAEMVIRQYASLLRSEAPICQPESSGALALPLVRPPLG